MVLLLLITSFVMFSLIFFLISRPQPRSPLFPYTTLFRSALHPAAEPATAIGGARPERLRAALEKETAPRSRSPARRQDRKSTRLNSSHVSISYAVFCLKKKNADSFQALIAKEVAAHSRRS